MIFMIKFETIKKIIDQWDPIDLLYFAPKNEYDFEIRRILSSISYDDTIETLGNLIYEVFIDSFGNISFSKSLEECKMIAKRILEEIKV